jgi:hypothetical protein
LEELAASDLPQITKALKRAAEAAVTVGDLLEVMPHPE